MEKSQGPHVLLLLIKTTWIKSYSR